MFMQGFYQIAKFRFLSELHFIYEGNIKTADLPLRHKLKDKYHIKGKEKS